ncbi:DsrE/DsrF/DrsH-like family protein [Alicyclobacillus mengziensis]|uniref:DsrE/DsrF/DrsH-like family protein n=1 Tax=Alicyclobacillus mengziensis TaxID=2931921 RepID=A0A9X7VXG4_9BACL|nr:DsrE/DsrF/DrsH-like family protein [Alicyclobacillus mengziensis]QSO46350.1 DsrE/DsrF/DrsH-like family protein [Alicyclobacillus mengziensis]
MAETKNRVAMIASGAGLETAYKVLNIATAAAASDAEVAVFCTFDGLMMIHKNAEELLKLGPGREQLAEGFKKAQVPSLSQMLTLAKECGVKFIACQMTMDVMGIELDDLIEGIDVGGAVTFLDFAFDANVTATF